MKRPIVRCLLALLVILVLMLGMAPVALADDGSENLVAANQLWGLLVSVAVPLVTGLLCRQGWPKWSKALTAFLLAAVVGVMTTYLTGNWGGGAWVIVLACYGAAQTTFWVIVDRVPGLKAWLYDHLNTDPDTNPE
jgi:predicted Na+-dependent transporter